MSVIWLDGKFVPSRKATANILSHALHYGTGVFEGIRAYQTANGSAVFRLPEHVDRFFRSISAFGVALPYTKKEIKDAIREAVLKNKLRECYIRPIAFFGEGSMGLTVKNAVLHVAIAAWPWGAYLGGDSPLSIGISNYARFDPRSIVPGAKISGFYATSVLASIEAHRRGFDECVLLDTKGYVSEGPGENIFLIKHKILYTPDSASILPGITRESIMTIAKDMGIRTVQKPITVKELMAADEAFFSGTAVEVASIGKIERRRIGTGGTGPVTGALKEAYASATHGAARRYRSWLTSVRR
ncbi:MAG TPA: branched-chain amino acid transaminase [Candidatus Paceibacterota bacterium]|nr:branched-chain amino acid transaminase [Candidatus Paceibacterota bacterium]